MRLATQRHIFDGWRYTYICIYDLNVFVRRGQLHSSLHKFTIFNGSIILQTIVHILYICMFCMIKIRRKKEIQNITPKLQNAH